MSDTVTAMTEPTFGRADRSPWAPFLRLALASILAITLLAFLLPAGASARDIVIGDSSTPLSAGAAGPNFANTAVSPTSPAATQSGNCLTPNVSIGNSSTPAGPTAATDVRDAIQKAVTPASMGVQAGDNVYFCNISQSGTGAPAANTYAPAEAGNTATAVDLSGTPGITIAALPGQTPTLLANGIGTNDYRFFTDTNAQGREFTLKDLVLSQGPISTQSGGFIRVSNAVTPGKLVIDGITADEFEVNSGPPDPDGGVIAAENVEVIDSSFGTKDDNSTDGDGGAIAADGDVLVRSSKFGSREESSVNQAQADGGAIAAGGDVVVEGSAFEGNQAFADGGAIAARGRVEVTGTPSVFIGYDGGFSAADNGGAIHAQSVLVANASRFGVDTAPEPDVGIGLEADGDGGAIATYNVTAGCNDASPSTPCVPGVVEITGAATFGDNVADGNGGAIYAAGGVSINGQTSGVRFISTPNFVNEAAGGGAIALGGLFNGANTGPSPRACVASSSLTNLNFTGQKAFANGGGAVHVQASATDLTDPTKRCTVGLSGSTFDSNTAAGGPGGALFIGGGNVSVTDTTFDSNTTTTSGDGGAVATGGDATNATRFPVTAITGSSFTDNQSVARGGAVANGVSALNTPQTTVSDTVLDGNTAPGGGGGISSAGPGSITVTGSELTDNTAGTTGSGGGSLIAGTGNVTIETSEFLRNTAGTTSGNGGAISLNTSGATKTITGNSFSGNTAKGTGGGSGGAIYTGVSLGLTPAGSFSDNLFTQNAASAAGGAVLHQATGSMTLSDSTFQSNYAVASGGAVASTSGTLTVSQSEFQSNGSQGDGGALLGSGPGSTVLDGSSFLGNRAGVDSQNAFVAGGSGADGGAAKITSATYRVTDSSFVQNLAANDGGGVDAASNGSAAGDGVSGSDFSGNRAGAANAAQASAGGGLNLSGAFTQNVTTSEFLLNEAIQTNTNASAVTRGGAIAATGGNLNLSRSTVAGNAVSASAQVAPGGIPAAGGGLYLASAHTATSANSTFTANRAPVAAVAWSGNGGGTLTFTSSTIAGNQAPTGSSILVSAKTAAGAINVTNSVIAEGSNYGSACLTGTGGTVVNGGGNVLTETTECGGTVLVGTGGAPATKVTSARLALGALADNGGPTETMALALDSVARNSAGVNALGGSPRDQRGLARPLANQSSGAYQLVVADIDVSRAGAGQGTVVSSPAGISCGETCRSAFALNSEPGKVTLTATASTGSIFQSWTGPCASVSGNQCVVDLSSGQLVSITANFRDSSGTLTVSRAGNGEGRVTSGPGGPIDCGTQCVAELDQGSTITLTAEPLGKSTFGGWSGACAAAGKSPTCTLTMDVAKTVTATFFESARVKIKWSGDRFKVPKNRTISVGQVECVNGTCEVIQATVKVEVGGKAYRAKAKVNRDSFTEGQSRPVKVIIPKAAYRRLGKGSGSGSLKLVVRAQASLPGSFIEVNRSLNASLRR